jgi:hypothetical protein
MFRYDQYTLFVEPGPGDKRQIVEQTIEAIAGALS